MKRKWRWLEILKMRINRWVIRRQIGQGLQTLLDLEKRLDRKGYTRKQKACWWDDFVKHPVTRLYRLDEVFRRKKPLVRPTEKFVARKVRKSLIRGMRGLVALDQRLYGEGYITRKDRKRWQQDFAKHESSRLAFLTEALKEVRSGL